MSNTSLDAWLARLGEEAPPPPPELFYLDPTRRRGPLVAGDGSWHNGDGCGHGCQVARALARSHFKNVFTTPWGEAAVAAEKEGAERTSLLPWETA